VADINQLSAVDTLSAGDLLPIWKTNNGDTRKAAMSVLQAYMQNNLTFPSATGQAQFVPQYASPIASGFTVTLTSNSDNRWLILTPLAGYAAGTIVFPALGVLADNQEIIVTSTQTISAITLNGNGASIIGVPASLSAGGSLRFKFNSLASTWYRIDENNDRDFASLSTAQTFTAQQTLSGGLVIQTVSAASIAALGNAINTANKVAGKVVYDTTNNRIMIASGSTTAAPWYVADGSASVTPS
jgi:hypothetical protein